MCFGVVSCLYLLEKGKTQIYRKGKKRKLFCTIRSGTGKLVRKGEDILCRRSIVVAPNLEASKSGATSCASSLGRFSLLYIVLRPPLTILKLNEKSARFFFYTVSLQRYSLNDFTIIPHISPKIKHKKERKKKTWFYIRRKSWVYIRCNVSELVQQAI